MAEGKGGASESQVSSFEIQSDELISTNGVVGTLKLCPKNQNQKVLWLLVF